MGLVVKATPWPLYCREIHLLLIVQDVGWVPEPGLTGVRNLASAGIFLKHKSFIAHILQLQSNLLTTDTAGEFKFCPL
jgi:hypothetical protein